MAEDVQISDDGSLVDSSGKQLLTDPAARSRLADALSGAFATKQDLDDAAIGEYTPEQLLDAATSPEAVARLGTEFAPVARLGGLQPSPLTSPVETAADTSTVFPLEVWGGYVWGYIPSEGTLHRQPVEGGAWEPIAAAPTAGTVIRMMPTSDDEVLLAFSSSLHKSSGWGTGSVSWTAVHTVNSPTNILRSCLDGDGTRFLVTSYAAEPNFAESRYVWGSTDAGETWEVVYDSVAVHGEDADSSHMHAVCFDPWADRWYISEGHGDIAGLYWSDDWASWQRAEGMHTDPAPVTVTATDDGLVCGSDNSRNGIYGVLRRDDPMDEALVRVWAWQPGAPGIAGFARSAYRDPSTGLVYIGFRSNSPDVKPMICAGTPTSGGLVWEWEDRPNPGTDDRIERVLVPTPGRLLAFGTSDSSFTMVEGALGRPTVQSAPDPGQVLGGTIESGLSVAVGPQAHAQGLRSTAVGVKATTPTGFQHNVCVGYAATAGNNNGVSVGYQADTAADGVSIGHATSSAGLHRAVLIGSGVTISGGGNGVAVGYQAFARGNSVSVGYQAKSKAGTTRSVALGYLAEADSWAVALGAEVVTTAQYQVAVGPRHFEVLDLADDPAAPASGATRLYAKGGKLYYRTSDGVFELAVVEP